MRKGIRYAAALGSLSCGLAASALAHHSFAMYDVRMIYNFTGVVTRVVPNSAHLILHFVPLNETRDSVVRNAAGEPVEWTVELGGSGAASRYGITVNGFPRGSIISLGLHPLRDGRPGGGIGNLGLYKCPANTPPSPGQHCDSVDGATSHSDGSMEAATAVWQPD